MHHIRVHKTARYYTLGSVETAKNIWVVMHGYGQSVERFVSKFECLLDGETAVIAPEGLHRFYTTGFSGDIGASWMTKEDRLHDIEDYVAYLNQLAATLITEDQKLIVLGFSQGSATACRWLIDGNVRAKALVLWAGLMPPDLKVDEGSEFLTSTPIFLAHSPTDIFRTDAMWLEQDKLLAAYGISPINFEYEGGHKIVEEALLRLVEVEIRPLLSG